MMGYGLGGCGPPLASPFSPFDGGTPVGWERLCGGSEGNGFRSTRDVCITGQVLN